MKVKCRKTGRVLDACILTEPFERAFRQTKLVGRPGDYLVEGSDGGYPIRPQNFDALYEVIEQGEGV
ncbi:hypothetical protein [Azospirillum picis]|uniref:Uncharacterized protein n=1 Tax=Azospirillum picis TaxID=488438 RepID=A0ABU0MPK4_9PROT|nr:hypothetical protein [Azospirillum picis]MBP2301575.1 hypothetical protein [Azospirillum picis]MDQ0535407.1 hypothetical protein [Azospirillum picis]